MASRRRFLYWTGGVLFFGVETCSTSSGMDSGTMKLAMSLAANPNRVTKDRDGQPFRYRRSRLATLRWLSRHPDRHTQRGLMFSVWTNLAISWFRIGWAVFATLFVAVEYGRTGSVSALSITWLVLAAIFLYQSVRSEPAGEGSAAAFDLKEKICPACGYPLTHQDKDDSPANMLCTECGRRWTVAERAEIIETRRSTPQPDSKTDATD